MRARSEETTRCCGARRVGYGGRLRSGNAGTENLNVGDSWSVIRAAAHDSPIRDVVRRAAPIPVIDIGVAWSSVSRSLRFLFTGPVVHYSALTVDASLRNLTARRFVATRYKQDSANDDGAKYCWSFHPLTLLPPKKRFSCQHRMTAYWRAKFEHKYFRVSPPSVHQMVLTNGLIERVPGQGRSIHLLISREILPDLE
jgi:hypothetical protein